MTDATGGFGAKEGLAIGSGALSIMGSLMGGAAQSDQYKAQARMIERQIKESYIRAKDNINLISTQHQQVLARQQVATASQGKVGGRGSNYLLLEDTMNKMGKEINNYSRDVAWQMYDMRYQGETQKAAAKNAMTTALIKSLGTAVDTAVTVIENPDKPQTETQTPSTLMSQNVHLKNVVSKHRMLDKDFEIFKTGQTTMYKRK